MPDPEVVIEEEIKPPETGSIEVDITEKVEVKPDAKPADVKPVAQPAEPTDISGLSNQLSGARRIIEKLQRDIAELKQRPQTTVAPAAAPQAATNEYDKLVEQGQWQTAVTKIAEQAAASVLTAKQAEAQFNQVQESREQIRQGHMKTLLTTYTELDEATGDPASLVSVVFNKVLDAHPEYSSSELGPRTAMRDMEHILLIEHGILPRGTTPVHTKETARQARVNQASLPPGRPAGKPGVVTLSKEQKELCDMQGIPYADYARSLLAVEQGGGIST